MASASSVGPGPSPSWIARDFAEFYQTHQENGGVTERPLAQPDGTVWRVIFSVEGVVGKTEAEAAKVFPLVQVRNGGEGSVKFLNLLRAALYREGTNTRMFVHYRAGKDLAGKSLWWDYCSPHTDAAAPGTLDWFGHYFGKGKTPEVEAC